jgi:NADH-quinone oxidoreductase subunit M
VVIQMLAHGLSAGALFILCGEIYERMHTRDLREMGGLWTRLRYLPPIALFFTAASLGLPGLGNFVGEFLILMGSYKIDPVVTIVATGGLILAAVYSLLMMQRAFYGEGKSSAPLEDLSGREISLMLSLVALLLMLGVYPQPVLDTSATSMSAIEQIFNPPAVELPAVTPTVSTGL